MFNFKLIMIIRSVHLRLYKHFILQKVKPSPNILWNICNVLASYAFTVRRFLGEHQDYSSEALHTIMNLSANLNSNVNFDSKRASIDNVIFQVTNVNTEYIYY